MSQLGILTFSNPPVQEKRITLCRRGNSPVKLRLKNIYVYLCASIKIIHSRTYVHLVMRCPEQLYLYSGSYTDYMIHMRTNPQILSLERNELTYPTLFQPKLCVTINFTVLVESNNWWRRHAVRVSSTINSKGGDREYHPRFDLMDSIIHSLDQSIHIISTPVV